MANYANILAEIAAAIYTNDNEEITGAVMQSVLLDMVASLGAGYQFMGIASPSTQPGTPDQKVWYIGPSGSYPNFGATADAPFVVEDGKIAIFKWANDWSREKMEITAAVEIVNNLTEGGADKALSAEMGKKLNEIIYGTLYNWNAGAVQSGNRYYRYLSVGTVEGMRIAVKLSDYANYQFSIVVTSGSSWGSSIVTDTEWQAVDLTKTLTAAEAGNYVRIVIRRADNGNLTVGDAEAVLSYLAATAPNSGFLPGDDAPKQGSQRFVTSAGLYDLVEGEAASVSYGTSDLPNFPYLTAQVSSRTRGYIVIPLGGNNYTITVAVASGSTIKAGIRLSRDMTWSSYNYDTGWISAGGSQTVTQANDTARTAKYLHIALTYTSTNTGVPTMAEVMQYITFSMTAAIRTDGLEPRLDAVEEAMFNKMSYPRIGFRNYGEKKVVGEHIDLALQTWDKALIGTLSAGTDTRQGGAIYGDYLFQFHNTLASIVVFNLATAQNVQVLSLTAMANCHAGSGGFSGDFYDASDPFPLLYISSMDEKAVYVYRITGTEGAWTITMVQTLSLSVDFYLPNITVDAFNGRIVVFGYTEDSWSSPGGNDSHVCWFPIPDPHAGNVTVINFYGHYRLPFIYAQQGACALFGKLYLCFGNTGAGQRIGGIIVIDYTAQNVVSYIDLGPMASGNFEPEAIGIWDGTLVVTNSTGGVYKLIFS